jgi:hypothetical protein
MPEDIGLFGPESVEAEAVIEALFPTEGEDR